jgi:hypothetical protein
VAENSNKQQKKPRGRPFKPGESGNPGGRPPGYAAFRESFRAEKDLDVIKKRLMKIFTNGDAKDADVIMASRLWYEYGFGKAPSAPEDNEALQDGLTVVVQSLAERRGGK